MTGVEQRPAVVSGWVVFAATMATIAGVMNLIYGIAVLLNDSWTALAAEQILALNLTAWGWVLIILGVIQLLVSYGIASGQTWARLAGILWASVIAIGQMAFLSVYPVWSVLIIAMSVMVIYGLAAYGDEV